jgi:MSHA biogenesis protein MshP
MMNTEQEKIANLRNSLRQRGGMLVVAMFTLVICGIISAASLRMLGTTQLGNAYEVQSARAFFAAETGINREMERIFIRPALITNPAPTPNTCAAAGGNWSLNFNTSLLGLKNCSVAITCVDFLGDTNTSGALDGSDERYYKIESTGTCGSASRTLKMTARSI